ncbi:MAG: AlpA family phage regulatory protein [Pseudomonadota bacterium]|nr:AlpA family phage regulatory protein [Pseudomonadota bacterium]
MEKSVLPAPAFDRLIPLGDVERLTGLRSSALYLRVARGEFPTPLRVSARCSRWRESEVIAWVAALPRGLAPRPGTPAAAAP